MSIIRSKRPLVVYPNPFHALDHEGRPACAVRLDTHESVSVGMRRWIGAKLRSKLIEKRDEGDGRGDLHDRTYDFDVSPHSIPDTDYHRERVRCGELVAGDASTAQRASLGAMKVAFREPREVLEEERARALATWTQEVGDRHDPAGASYRFPWENPPAPPADEPKADASAAETPAEAAPADTTTSAPRAAHRPGKGRSEG